MTRTRKLFIAGLCTLGVAMALIAAVLTMLALRHVPGPVPHKDLPEHALTPEETVTEVALRKDGTARIRQRVIFEIPDSGAGPVSLWFSGATLGDDPRVRHGRFAMLPQVSKLTAVELSTEPGSTQAAPVEMGPADIAVNELKITGFADKGVQFTFRPQDSSGEDSSGEAAQWSPGRHVLQLSYVLDKVFVSVGGEDLFTIPLPALGTGGAHARTNTMTIEADGPLYCLEAKHDFALGEECSDFSVDTTEGSAEARWKQDFRLEVEALAVKAPAGMTVRPIAAQVLG